MFLSPKLLKLAEIGGVKVLAWNSGDVNFFDKFHVCILCLIYICIWICWMPEQKATSAHKDMRDARREEKKMVDGIADTVLYTLYFILYTLYYTILLNYILDGGWDCRCLPRQHPRMSRDIQKRQMNFFKVFFQFQCLRLVHSVIGVYEWKANEQAIANDYNYNLISNYSEDRRYQLDTSSARWAWALGIGHAFLWVTSSHSPLEYHGS